MKVVVDIILFHRAGKNEKILNIYCYEFKILHLSYLKEVGGFEGKNSM